MKINKIVKTLACAVMAATLTVGGATGTLPFTGTDNNTAIVAEAAVSYGYNTKTGDFNGNNWSGWTTVNPRNSRNNAHIKVCAFRQNGKINSGKFKVDIYSGNWNYCGTVWCTGSKSISLNYGYDSYRVRIRRTDYGSNNVARTQYWSIDAGSNVYSMF